MFNALGKEAVGLLLDHLPEQVPPLAGRYRVQAFFNTPLQTFYGAIESQLPHGAGSVQGTSMPVGLPMTSGSATAS